ncbi:MAG: efflux RND transporter periplasmic adaptor subunit [Methylophagaceae bacterium]
MTNDYKLNIDDEQNSANFKQKANSFLIKTKELIWMIPRKGRIVLSIVLFTFIVILILNIFKPEAQKRAIPETVVRVDVIEASLSNYPIVVSANGTIEAETRGNLVAQIRGEIIGMSDDFKTGGSFQKGDVLIQIDPRDYQAALSQAMASLSQADAAYRQERANSKQAIEDWKRLGNVDEAPTLVKREPQLAAAKAQLDSAKAAQQTANLNLSRTQITAPYTGRIIRREAVLGQYVSVGTPIAELFSSDGVEVRLPISQAEFAQLGLDQFDRENGSDFNVDLSSKIGSNEYHWNAKITRTDSTFDINTRQIDVIAKVANPFSSTDNGVPLKIGQFVSARIQGQTVENVYIVPNKSIREGSYTYVARNDRLVRQNIEIIWQDDQNTLVSKGIGDGDLIVTTSLNSTLAGAKVKFSDEFIASNKSKLKEVEPKVNKKTSEVNAKQASDVKPGSQSTAPTQ